jgi:hypothetical protein
VLLGAAFGARELRLIYRRAAYTQWDTASDYALHSSAVRHAATRNDCSRLLHQKLDERFAGVILAFRAAGSREEVVVLWQHWCACGEAVAAYWAAITHPLTDLDTDELLSQEMHMLSHFAFAERRAAARRLRAADERIAELDAGRTRALARADALQAANATLRRETAAARAAADLARAQLESARSEQQITDRDARIAALAADRDAAQRAARLAERRAAELADRLAQAAPTAPPAAAPSACPPQDASLQPLDLGQKRILCVGGKTRLVAHYRALVEQANGVFAHHDGGLEDHESRLPALLGSADAVVCLAADVSHGAYGTVKRYCKRFAKPCVLMASSSVTTLARSLAGTFGAAGPERRGRTAMLNAPRAG